MTDELTDDAITADFRLWQRRRGHRYSLDDVLTAAEALRAAPDADRVLDLGTGIGSVLLMVAWKLPRAQLVGLEAQEGSVALALRNVKRNGLRCRVAIGHGDLREPTVLSALPGAPFALVTGTPPYFPVGTATLPPDAQRAHARHELRGGVEDYVRAAAQVLAPDGRFVICADARRPARVLHAAAGAGLSPLRQLEVVAREGREGPLFTVWTLAPAAARSAPVAPEVERFVARHADGNRTRAYRALRAFFGLGTEDGAGG